MRKAIKDLIACKVQAQCDRDRLANEFLAGVTETKLAARQARLELYRQDKELPVCPPDCLPENAT